MKNHLTISQRWADVKSEIVMEHERVAPVIERIIEDHERVSGQAIPPKYIGTTCELNFYPYWRGFTYTYATGWDSVPNPEIHWKWTLKESQEVLDFLKALHEEELKLLFCQWTEECCV